MTTSHTVGDTAAPLLETTIGTNLRETVARHATREALVDVPSGRRWTYAELLRDVDAVARGLLQRGVERGDRVGIWAPNSPEWVLLQYATARIGAILVNVNPAYRAHELAYVVGQSGMRTIVAVEEFKGADYVEMMGQAQVEHPSLEDVVLIGTASWDDLVAGGRDGVDDLDLIESGLSATDPINIQYTSGTTGFPKGATLSHRNILNNGWFVGELLGYTEHDRVCVPVPFYHCFGMVMGNLACTSHGSTIVIPAPGFDPGATLRAVTDERCTSLYGVPTMFIAMLNDPGLASAGLDTLRTGIMAGSPCPVETMTQVIERMGMAEVSICYGMTETSPVSLQTRPHDSLEQRVSTVGRVGPHLEVKVVDPTSGATLERGEVGELCTRGYSVMIGYWGEPEKTDEAIDGDGWMHTGDLGTMDADGYVSITGRIKDLVIRGGENIYPREIEEFLLQHPDVIDVQVIGVPDAKYGEELMAWLRVREGATPPDAAAIREFCAGRLAHFKTPRYVHCVDDFPMTITGKVRKVEMREAAPAILRAGGAEPPQS
ncbi:AMP-binding protein [Aeromicrobium alkaliterrae]|uniref:AMP-binding protein n=1 Tax=Aeromicrobium alkaliterrae TaxID=302168 RepID=A0ABN2K7A4_9ACTN